MSKPGETTYQAAIDLRSSPDEVARQMWNAIRPGTALAMNFAAGPLEQVHFWSALMHEAMGSMVAAIGADAARMLVQHLSTCPHVLNGVYADPSDHQVMH